MVILLMLSLRLRNAVQIEDVAASGLYIIYAHGKRFRCTQCAELDISDSYWENETYYHHINQVHAYDSSPWTWVESQEELQFACMSCGFKYNHSNPLFRVSQCTERVHYSVCKKCKEQGMHNKYKIKFKYKLLSEYFDKI